VAEILVAASELHSTLSPQGRQDKYIMKKASDVNKNFIDCKCKAKIFFN